MKNTVLLSDILCVTAVILMTSAEESDGHSTTFSGFHTIEASICNFADFSDGLHSE